MRKYFVGWQCHRTYFKNAELVNVGHDHAEHILMAKDHPDEGHAADAVQTADYVWIR